MQIQQNGSSSVSLWEMDLTLFFAKRISPMDLQIEMKDRSALAEIY